MAAIVLGNLAGLTVTYNGMQFGGADSDHSSVPPIYSFVGDYVWDDARRAIKFTKYVLTVSTIFYAANEALVALAMEDAESRLGAHGKALTIEGLGSGFDRIYTPSDDIAWGPKPLGVQCTPYGQLAWTCVWSVEFCIKQCVPSQQGAPAPVHPELAFLAFNFDTTWQNDLEGLCTRTISGYVEIAIHRDATGKIPKHVADEVRNQINVVVPNGFRRLNNTWHENASKERLEFSITDEYFDGDSYPEGITIADGSVSFSSEGPGFATSQVSLSMSLKVAPDKPRGLAGVLFLAACITKTNAMILANEGGTVIPTGLRLDQGKFGRAREFSGSMTWTLVKCINKMIEAAGIWEPIKITEGADLNYTAWRTSMANLWNNRGFTPVGGNALRSAASEGVVIDLCSNVTNAVIGTTPYDQQASQANNPIQAFTCPEIPADGGWMGHDVKLTILREDEMSWHKKAVVYSPAPGQVSQAQGGNGKVPVGGVSYTQNPNQEHDVEHHGFPETYILLQFKGLRLKHHPIMPELKSVNGKLAHLVKQEVSPPKIAFDVLTCSAWYISGYRVYRVNGPVDLVTPTESLTSCAAPNGNNQTP